MYGQCVVLGLPIGLPIKLEIHIKELALDDVGETLKSRFGQLTEMNR